MESHKLILRITINIKNKKRLGNSQAGQIAVAQGNGFKYILKNACSRCILRTKQDSLDKGPYPYAMPWASGPNEREKSMELNFFSMISHASLVAKAVLALLVLMSIYSWGLMIQKFFSLGSANNKAIKGIDRFDKAPNLRDAVQSLGADPASPLYFIAHQGVLEFNRSKELGNSSEVVVDNVRRALRQGAASEMSRLQRSLSKLATISNTAPFIGLFGTVWGIMNSFHSIGLSKSASLATVAPGISEALVATAIGLAVAVPATVGYNLFIGKLSQVDTLLVNFAGYFLNRVQRELNAHRPIQRTGATEL